MITLNESYLAELGFELATPGFAIRYTTDCTMELVMVNVSAFVDFYLRAGVAHIIDVLGMGLGEATTTGNLGLMNTGF